MSEFIGIKSLLGVYGYKFKQVVPTLFAFDIEELLEQVKLKHKKAIIFEERPDFLSSLFEPIDTDRSNLARQGLLNELKRDMLFFDKIYVCPEEYQSVLNWGVSELEDIYERGYFKFSESTATLHSGPLAEATRNTDRVLMHYWPCLHRVWNNDEKFVSNIEVDREEVKNLFHRLKRLGFKKALQEFSDFGQFSHDIQARRDALLLNKKYELDVVPIVNSNLSFDIAKFTSVAPKKLRKAITANDKQNVAHIILDKLPLPTNDVSISQIMDFKEESETRRLFLGMKRWLRKTLDSNTSLDELNEEIEYLTLEYKHYMKIHNMKTTTGTLETLVVTSAEIIENLAKLNIGKAAKSFFYVQNERLALAEAEIKAPGREISYLIYANNKFG